MSFRKLAKTWNLTGAGHGDKGCSVDRLSTSLKISSNFDTMTGKYTCPSYLFGKKKKEIRFGRRGCRPRNDQSRRQFYQSESRKVAAMGYDIIKRTIPEVHEPGNVFIRDSRSRTGHARSFAVR